MSRVVIGMDPHKRSATIEVIDEREQVLARGRYGTEADGYQRMLTTGRTFPERVWAVEGCAGIGRHIAQRLVADGETVIDVPAKLSARVRVFDTGQGRKTDLVDAHSVAVAGLRTPGLRTVAADDHTVVLRLLVDRRDELGRARTEVVSRIHHLLLELVPGGAKKFLTRGQASYLLRTAPPPAGIVAQTRHDLARELIDELTTIDAKIKEADARLRHRLATAGSSLTDLNGIGPSGAARLLGDITDIRRFRTAAHFASWNGTAPLEASSGDQHRHRLSRLGNRRINRVLHIMAIVQLRHDTPGRAYYRRRQAEGKTTMEALRALKRHLSDIVYKQMLRDTKRPADERARSGRTGPGGQSGATLQSSADGPIPTAATSDKSQPGPATN
ncbi:IS110 family transposase, partial [Dactylosporangium salmoneum]|uniref:IS110 family transposase n=1 Tax=Dactylosporangium salmoneum TaxID=53361 RepID=UPI0031CDD6F0